MPEWKWLLVGLLIGWLLEWVVDWIWWRGPRGRELPPMAPDSKAPDPDPLARGRDPLGDTLDAVLAEPVLPDPRAEAAAAARVLPDHLELIEGIGPKIAAVLRSHGILSYGQIAELGADGLNRILQEAGPRFRYADCATWPAQARLAQAGHWDELESLQKHLAGESGAGMARPAAGDGARA